jgi:hypothetical protein
LHGRTFARFLVAFRRAGALNERPGRRWCGKPGLDQDAVRSGGMTHRQDTPEIFSDGVFFPSFIERTAEEWSALFAALSLPSMKHPKPPTLASVTKEARKAGIEVARIEIKPDGTVVAVVGKQGATVKDDEVENWLSKQKGH